MSKIKVGVFGAARGMTMVHQVSKRDDAKLVAVCDKYVPALEKCRETAAEYSQKIECFESFDDFIQCDMDAVVLANYAHEHVPFAIRLLESGRHIMSEVLACATLAQGATLADCVEKTGKIYTYAENYCYFNTTAEMRRRYRQGDIGELMHGEGEYIHDCSSIWPRITYGDRNHWRNRSFSTFYVTHSLGPVLFSTGLRPETVVGFESPNRPFMSSLGNPAGSHGVVMVQLSNGAIVKSVHGGLKREPGSINYQLYGTKGSMETDRWESNTLHVYIEGERNCIGEHTKYKPEFEVSTPGVEGAGHGGSDFFTTHYFLRAIKGDAAASENCIDVYQALDMTLPGILAYRSILDGNTPQCVPNFRIMSERDKYRDDNFTTFEEFAGENRAPRCSFGEKEIPDEVYNRVKALWEAGENA